MSIVTISRQIGSYGHEIGKQVADRLGYQLTWRDLINKAAKRAGAPDVALAMIDEFQLLGVCPSPQDCQKYIQVVQQVMEEMASQGNYVILGRAGQVILAGWPRCIHVRIIAPPEIRAARIAERRNISLKAAREQVKASDRTRRDYLKRFYQIQWDDPEHYDLVINTGQIRTQQAVGLICALASQTEDRASEPEKQRGEG